MSNFYSKKWQSCKRKKLFPHKSRKDIYGNQLVATCTKIKFVLRKSEKKKKRKKNHRRQFNQFKMALNFSIVLKTRKKWGKIGESGQKLGSFGVKKVFLIPSVVPFAGGRVKC